MILIKDILWEWKFQSKKKNEFILFVRIKYEEINIVYNENHWIENSIGGNIENQLNNIQLPNKDRKVENYSTRNLLTMIKYESIDKTIL